MSFVASSKGSKRYRRLNNFRHPTEYDRWVLKKASHDYWTGYYQAGLEVYPKFTKDVAEAVAAKLKHMETYDQDVDKMKRELLGKLVEASSANNVDGVNQIVGSLPHFLDLNDCIQCLVERKHDAAAKHLFGIQYDQDGEDDPKAAWIARELAEMRKMIS